MQAIIERGYTNQIGAKDEGIWTAWATPIRDGGWINILLWKKQPGPKGRPYKPRKKYAYHLGWNGQRFARSSEIEILRAREPEVYSWIKDILKEQNK